jgi:hypothetical protein
MDSMLPPTGTCALLRELSPYIPDDFINQLRPSSRGCGRRHAFSLARLWRVHLLALLTPVHSFNLLCRLLPEQREWRRFAHLAHRRRVPDVRMLHEFREQVGVAGLRRINDRLLEPLLPPAPTERLSVSIIDATDLEAAALRFKKKPAVATRPSAPPWGSAH